MAPFPLSLSLSHLRSLLCPPSTTLTHHLARPKPPSSSDGAWERGGYRRAELTQCAGAAHQSNATAQISRSCAAGKLTSGVSPPGEAASNTTSSQSEVAVASSTPGHTAAWLQSTDVHSPDSQLACTRVGGASLTSDTVRNFELNANRLWLNIRAPRHSFFPCVQFRLVATAISQLTTTDGRSDVDTTGVCRM